jgi:hypothetical protein
MAALRAAILFLPDRTNHKKFFKSVALQRF